MPLHFEDLDVISAAKGSKSALIVPCNMCPAATVADRENKPFLRIFKDFLKSAPFEKYISTLQERLLDQNVRSKVFKSNLPHQWFLCMWTSARQRKLQKHAQRHDTVIVLGCESATRTVRDSIGSTNCKLIEGMEPTGIMNTKLSMRFPCDICFKDSKVIPFSPREKGAQTTNTEPNPNTVAKAKRRVLRLIEATS
jgi:hypothetical protein